MDYHMDIICSDATQQRFLDLYDLDLDFFEAVKYVISNNIVLHNTKNIGKKVKVSYMPASQKYIEYYDSQSFEGIIFFDDPLESNFFMINNNNIQSFKREGSHFFGMTDCYDGFIEYL